MEQVHGIAAIWIASVLVSTFVAIWRRTSTGPVEVLVGAAAGAAATCHFGPHALGSELPWRTFLTGSELASISLRTTWKETSPVGSLRLLASFLGRAAMVHFLVPSAVAASLLAGVAVSHWVVPGHPIEESIHVADQEKDDLTVLGGSDPTRAFGRAPGGADRPIVRQSPCSVLLAR